MSAHSSHDKPKRPANRFPGLHDAIAEIPENQDFHRFVSQLESVLKRWEFENHALTAVVAKLRQIKGNQERAQVTREP